MKKKSRGGVGLDDQYLVGFPIKRMGSGESPVLRYLNESYTEDRWGASAANLWRFVVAGRPRFTRIPKTYDLVLAGCPTEVIPTYCALADYANNKTGLCWPRMETLARRLSRSPRTIQRHLHLLKEIGLIEFVERKRDTSGRFGAYVYKILHIVVSASTGHQSRMALFKRTKRQEDPPKSPKGSAAERRKQGYGWLFGDPDPPEQDRKAEEQRRRNAERRREGYEWLFK